jgi:hypothetical protein
MAGQIHDRQKLQDRRSQNQWIQGPGQYQSGHTVNVADVLILNNSFKVGDSKFTLTGAGAAQVKTVFVSPYDGSTTLQTTIAKLQS